MKWSLTQTLWTYWDEPWFFWDLYSSLVVVLNCKWQSLRQASEIIRSFVAAASRCAFCRASWRTIADVLGEKWLQQWHTRWGWLVAGSDCFLGYFLSGPTLRCFTQLIQSNSSLRHRFSRELFFEPILLRQLPSVQLLGANHYQRNPLSYTSELSKLMSEQLLLWSNSSSGCALSGL